MVRSSQKNTLPKRNDSLLQRKCIELDAMGHTRAHICATLDLSKRFVKKALDGPCKSNSSDNKSAYVNMRLDKSEAELVAHLRDTGTIPANYIVHSDRNVVKLEAKYKEVKRLYSASLDEIETLTKKTQLFTSFDSYKTNKAILRIENKRRNVRSQSVAVAIASDWHLEERVDPSTVNDLNEYTIRIAQRRVKKFFEQTLYLTNLMRHETKIDTLILAILGDLMSGYIHEELRESNQMSPTETVLLLSRIIREGIDFLRDNGKFESIIVPCCFGNHSRTTIKPRHATAYKNSYEYLLYCFLSTMYENDSTVNFSISKGYHQYINVFGKYMLRFHHGNNIRYGGGVGGIAIPVNKAVAQWSRAKSAYLDCFGHFHQSLSGGRWICSGSLIGYNGYAISIKADFEKPQQTFFVLEKDKGLTFTGPIFVDD